MKYLTIVSSFLILAQTVKLPPNFKKCNRRHPDWKKCVLEAGVDGLSQLTKPFPEINLPNADPLFVPEVSIKASPTSTSVVLNQYLKNCYFHGLTDIRVQKFEFDFNNKQIIVEGTFNKMKMLADYQLDGKILLLPINGEGKVEITFKNLDIKAVIKFEEIKKKRKTYLKIVSVGLETVPELATFHLDNLFNGDKVLTDNMNKVLNDNWEVVYGDLKESYNKIVEEVFVNLLDGFFGKVSVEEAFD